MPYSRETVVPEVSSGWHPRSVAGEVVVYCNDATDRAEHDHATCAQIARRLAALKGYDFADKFDERVADSPTRYFVPTDTLIGVDHARALGIVGERDLFGGVAPHSFVATKCISHPLLDESARVPEGWSAEFARRTRGSVLAGFSAFSVEDALRAGLELLKRHRVRVKRALGIGGRGQVVVTDPDSLEQCLADVDAGEVARCGIALEQDLVDVTTYSVGQVRVDDLLATYCGTQRATPNNKGESVYGGSDLLVARGDFDALLAFVATPSARRAIEHARVYNDAAFECFAGLFASRRNYDVAEGRDGDGRTCSGVLEQSWRVGGASGAEVGALAAFRANPALEAVHASTVEIYGPDAVPPADATVYFHGIDQRVGPITKYSVVKPHAHP